jgi:hypothetical protein
MIRLVARVAEVVESVQMTTREDSAVGARQWQLGVVEEWLAAALDPSSQRHIEMENLARAVRRLLNNSFGYISPSTVVSQLLPVRTSCDELAFNDSAECLAYVCWHLVDRYGRIHQALDALFRRGHLPLRRRGRPMGLHHTRPARGS